MAMEITNRYSSYTAQNMAANYAANGAKKKETENTSETENYMKGLEKLAPSVEFKIGTTFDTAKTGKTLTIHPKLLEKMQNDPEKEKEMKELIKGVESMTRLVEGLNKATGWKTVYHHSYIDENGQYRAIAFSKNERGLKMSEKLREERKKLTEKLLEKSKEKAAQKKEKAKEAQEEKESANHEVEQLLNEKLAASKDGVIYFDDTDLKKILEAAKSDSADKEDKKIQKAIGANLDLQA